MDETTLRLRTAEATAKHIRRTEILRGSEIEQLCSDAYRTIDEAHPLQPFVSTDGRLMNVNERTVTIVKDAVRSNYRRALYDMHGIKTQKEIAEDVGVSLRTLQNWCNDNGLFRIDAETCERLCSALSVTVDELRGTAGVGRGLVSAYSTAEFADRYQRLSYHHQMLLTLMLRDFAEEEATEELLRDYQKAIEEASTKSTQTQV